MSHLLDEGRLRFDFGTQWKVERYDRDDQTTRGHAFYRNQVSRLPNTKAVDFVGVLGGQDTYLIEVKDFRRHRIENKKRLTSGELALEVAHKVRDTIAGMVGASRNESPPTVLSTGAALMLNRNNCVRIVLWLEDDAAGGKKKWEEELNTLTTRIQNHLRWFTPRVLVLSKMTHTNKPPHIQVSDVLGR